MKAPESKKELQTFMGFITYLQKFMPDMSEISNPLRLLLQKEIEWHWDNEKQSSFEKLKQMASETPVLAFYDKDKDLILNVDSSSCGLGAVLLQENKPIAYASRALNNTQKRYSQIEKETLAIVFGCQKFHYYLFGRHFTVESDHKPLESIFNKSIIDAPSRVQRFVMTLQKYDFTLRYKPGKSMYISETLSRLYLPESNDSLIPELDVHEIHLNAHLPMLPEKYESLKRETENDSELQTLVMMLENGWPEHKKLVPDIIKQYWPFKQEITSIDGIVFKGHKVIIPHAKRDEMLKIVHETHMGIGKCKERARQFMFWPGMLVQIQNIVEKCEICALHNKKTNRKETMISVKIPDRPSAKIGADLFECKGQHYLLTVDYHSKWPEIDKLDNLSSSNVISYMKKLFARFGYPNEVVSDNGPQFACKEFKQFAKECDFIHTTISPHYSQANGQTERFVQTVKNLIRKSNDPSKALLDYRNTPIDGIGLSPAQMHIGRRLKSSIPTAEVLLKPNYKGTVNITKLHSNRQKQQKYFYDKHCGKNSLSNLIEGQRVVIEHNKQVIPGTVVGKHHTPRSYIVKTDDGRKLRRNRKHLKPTKAEFKSKEMNDTEIKPREVNFGNSVSNQNQYEKVSINNQSNNEEKVVLNNQSNQSSNQSDENPEIQTTRSGRVVRNPAKYDDYVCHISEVFV